MDTMQILFTANSILYDLAVLLYAGSGLLQLVRPAAKNGRLPKIAKLSFFLFVLDGIPRMLFYHSMEWEKAVGQGRTGQLLAQIVVIGVLAGLGTYAWIKAQGRFLPGAAPQR